ncbi:replication initiation protein, partial [Streptomyces eurythermus]
MARGAPSPADHSTSAGAGSSAGGAGVVRRGRHGVRATGGGSSARAPDRRRASHPLSNPVVENPVNGHAHAVWALAEAVTRTEYTQRKPLAYAAAVTRACAARWTAMRRTRADDEEPAAHRLEHRVVPWRSPHARRAGGGAGRPHVARALAGDQADPQQHHGAGAYREVRHHFGSPDALHSAILAEVHTRNADFAEPLPTVEARAIANSIHRWITTRSRMWKDGAA